MKNVGKSTLNKQQQAAAEAPLAPLLIVAGAGTGKTTTLIARFVHLIETGIRPEKICAITFTNKAANEMRERIAAQMESITAERVRKSFGFGKAPFIGTFHSLGARILREECRNLELVRKPSSVATSENFRAKGAKPDEGVPDGTSKRDERLAAENRQMLAGNGISGQVLGRKKNFVIFDDNDAFSLIKKICKRMLKSEGDQAPASIKKLLQSPSFFRDKISAIKNLGLERVKERSSRYEDELALRVYELYEHELKENNAFDFDDLIEKVVYLLEHNPHTREKYQKLFDAILVDEYQDVNPKQYALIRVLAGAHRNISVVGDDEQMIYGWRYANLETFLNFEKDWEGAVVALLEENYRSTRAIINSASTLSKQNVRRRAKNLFTNNAEGTAIAVFEADNEVIEAVWIAGTIREMRGSRPQESIAILYRTNAQSRAIEQALIRAELPYIIFGGIKFYERKEIKDIVAALRYTSNPRDSVSRERLEKNFTKNGFAAFAEAISKLKEFAPVKVIETFIQSVDFFSHLEKEFLNFAEREENIAELISFAGRFETLEELLEEISLVQATDSNTGNELFNRGAPVHLMTVHLAKGLEFDTVLIAGASEGILPHARSMEAEDKIEEERRLMYVAMTRARKNLFMSFYDLPSRFLSELPQEFLKFENFLSRRNDDDGNWEENNVYY